MSTLQEVDERSKLAGTNREPRSTPKNLAEWRVKATHGSKMTVLSRFLPLF
jgi:hypothetical protein